MYNCVDSTVLGSYVVVLLGVSIEGGKGREERIHVGMAPGGSPVAYLGNTNAFIGRV